MITFNNIVERFKVFADAHFFVKSFSFGSPDDVDLSKFTNFPLMHLVYTGATYDAGTKTYNLEVYILDVPADKTKKTDRQKEVVSDAEQCAEDIIADIKNGGNIFLFAQDYEVVNATTTPLEEETKNVLSGVLLDLSVAIPYEWDACNAPIDGVTPEGGDEVAYARRGILRMLTVDGSTDVLSVRTIKVTNGTLTDDGDGVVTLDTGGAESLDDLDDVTITAPLATGQVIVYDRDASPRGFHNQENSLANLTDTNITSTPANAFLRYVDGAWEAVPVTIPSPPPSTTDGLPEGETNLYYTEDRVSANTDVAANTAKVGITAQQAADITANNAKVGITPTQASEITANTAKVGITTQQADDITANNAKVSLIAGGTTGQALVKSTGTDYDVEWADIAVDVQYHNRYQSESETLRAGGAETIELYYSAQADGDGLAESASSDTPAAGYDIRRKLYYSEAGFADPDTGTWTQFTAIADNTTFANAKAALLAYLKERTGGTVPISLKMTWEEVAQAPAFTGLLNESYGSGAEAAYSVRRLNGNYTGAAIQVERTSDNTTQDIGFDVDGNLDESALTTFCTGTVCKVRTWYDQSQTGGTGSGNDAVQTVHANQPTIYTGGAIVKENGKPIVQFDGSNDCMLSSTNVGANPTACTWIHVVNANTKAVTGYMTSQGSNTNGGFGIQKRTTGYLRYYMLQNGSGSVHSYREYQTDISDGNTRAMTTIWDGTNTSAAQASLYVNGSTPTLTSASFTGTYGDDDASSLEIASRANGTALQSDINVFEFIVYPSDKSTDRTSIESNIGDYFTQNTPLLDTYSGAAAAYSLRLLDSTYTGALVEVYNGSSYADIGFNVFGELDTVALAAHCGSNDGFVSKWYDQAGSNDAAQTTTANMPKIYDGTTGVVTKNGKPAIIGASSSSILSIATSITFSDFCIMHVYEEVTSNKMSWGADGTSYYYYHTGANHRINGMVNFVSGLSDGDYVLDFANRNSGAVEVHLNGSSVATASYTSSYEFKHLFNRQSLGFGYSAPIQEFVLWTSDQSSNRTNIEDNINTFYNIYS